MATILRNFFFLAVLFRWQIDSASANSVFMLLGDLPGGGDVSQAFGVSADGTVVVGSSEGASGTEAFRWTQQDGMVGLGFLGNESPTSVAHAISADGTTIIGYSRPDGDGSSAFRWKEETGMVAIGPTDGVAFDVSADGTIVVGGASPRYEDQTGAAFIWSESAGLIPMTGIPTSENSSAQGVSADGKVVVGWYESPAGSYPFTTAFRWEESTGIVELPVISQDHPYQYANDISADGSTIVGGYNPDFPIAIRWKDDNVEFLAGGGTSQATAVSADGSWTVGYSFRVRGLGAIWDAEGNIYGLRDILMNDYGVDLIGISLLEPKAISADGKVIVGNAWRAPGTGEDDTDAFILNLNAVPEPSMISLLVCLVLVQAYRYRHGFP